MRSWMLMLALFLCAPAGWAGPAVDPEISQLDTSLKQDAYAGLMRLLDAADRRWAEVKTYKGLLEKEERRQGKVQDKEVVNYRFIRDHGVRMEWLAPDKDKKVLYVHGKYQNQLSIQVRVMFKIRLPKDPMDPQVQKNANHPITESGFGQSLVNIRKLSQSMHQQGKLNVTYDGRGQAGPDGQPCLKITREFKGYERLTRAILWFDEATLMPVKIESYDRQGFLERYLYKRVTLNPQLPGGRGDELTVRDFYRSTVFPEDRDWGKVVETWKFEEIAPKWINGKKTIRF
jgi:outer membrane lipoprotein-sorting protein